MSLGQGLASKYYSGFNPLIYGGCALWVDAGDTTTLTLSGSNITAVRDKSPQSNAITVSSTQPTYVSNRQNGLGGIFMNGASWLINTTMSYPLANRTVFIVAEQTASSTTSFEGIIVFGGSAAVLDYNSSNAIVYTGRGSNAGQNISFSVYGRLGDYVLNSGISTTPMPFRVYSESFAYPNGTLFVDACQTVTDTAAQTVGTATGWVIGGRFDNSNATPRVPLYGYIYEILVYSNTLPAIDRQAVESYLMRKWGRVANIPTTHPYSTILPVTRSFLPLDISGCALWLDAADYQSFTLTGTDVSQWRDKSGSNNHMNQYSAATAPSVSTLNGYSTVYFNTTDPTSVQTTQPFTNVKVLQGSNFQTSSNSTVFLVATPTYTSTNTKFIVNLKSRNASAWANLYDWSLGTGNGTAGGGNGSYVRTDTTLVGADASYYASNTTTITNVQVTGTSVVFSRNGSNYASGTLSLPMVATDAYQVFTLGAYLNTDALDFVCKQGCRAHFNEVIVYNASITTQQRQQVEGYLAAKWGLRGNLPSTHLLKNSLAATLSFNPRQIEGCALWLDAADPTSFTFSSGSNISQWRDKSGNGYNATTISGTPTYSSNSVLFSNSRMDTGLSSSVNTETAFMVLNTPGTGDGSVLGAPAAGYRSFQISSNVMYIVKRDIVVNLTSTSNLPANTTTLLSYNTSSALWMNGSANGTGTATAFNTGGTTTRIGNDSRAFAYNGRIMEIIVYQQTLSTYQRQQIEGYIAWKWGLQSILPSTHPYKKISPI